MLTEPWLSRLDSRIRRIALSELNVIVVGQEETSQFQLSLRIHAASRLRRSVFLHLAPPFTELESLGEWLDGEGEQAAASRRRAFQGTLFINRVAELPPSAQRFLLRLLERREQGAAEPGLDFRIIVADNGDLPAEVGAGSFRHDLYYRLNEVVIRVPSTLAQTRHLARNHAEKRAIEKVLVRTSGDLPQTAELLRLSQPSLDQKIRGLGITLTDASVGREDGEIDQRRL